MNASGWELLFRRRAWAALGVALLFFAATVIVEAGEAKSTKRRAANAKPAAKHRTAAKPAPRQNPAPRPNLTISYLTSSN